MSIQHPDLVTRHLDFEAIENFRDFGGYATACGRGLRRGVLYRSANHHRATDADLQRMRDLGVAVIVDLRRAEERAREPSRRWDGFDAAVVENDIAAGYLDWTVAMQGAELTPQWFYDDAMAYYRRAPHEPRHIDLYARYFRALAETDGALVVHCAAGKDRTGLICALTHHLAGVHPDDVLADYLLTNDEARMARKIAFLGPWLERTVGQSAPEAALRVAVSVNPDYLRSALGVILETHGSLDGYLEQALGIDAALRERVRERILN